MMAGKINRDALRYLIKEIPRNSRGAEIGVWHGNTSLALVSRVAELHLVDPWSVQPYRETSEHGTFEAYLERYTKQVGSDNPADFQTHYDQIHAKVLKAFAPWDYVTIHRMTSDQWFDGFTGELDWIYVDGDHSYKGCLNDLTRSLGVVRKGGYIFGDDYREPRHKLGVYRAVSEFRLKYPIKRFGKSQFRFTV